MESIRPPGFFRRRGWKNGSFHIRDFSPPKIFVEWNRPPYGNNSLDIQSHLLKSMVVEMVPLKGGIGGSPSIPQLAEKIPLIYHL